MKRMKKVCILSIIGIFLPLFVNAGEIRFNEPVKTSSNTYEFTLTVDNIRLNSIEGNIAITNGTITNVTMHSSWINKTGKNNTFYFYRNGASTGSYKVATIEVTMTNNSEYKINNLEYNHNKCIKDRYGNLFGENGYFVSKETYDATCSVSKDATLKSLSTNSGTLSPKFDPSLELYSIKVENSVHTIHFNAVPTKSTSKVVSGTNCALKEGANLCKIIVEAESGAKKTYTITVIRKNAHNTILSNDASIRDLKVHGGTLTKAFQPNIKEYDVKVDKTTTGIYFSFISNSNDEKQTSKTCNINDATSTCTLTVTAEDGKTKISYVFHILHENKAENNINHNNSNNSNNSSSNNNSGSTNVKPNTNENTNQNQNDSNTNDDKNADVSTDVSSNDFVNTNEDDKQSLKENDNNQEETLKVPIVNKEIKKDLLFKITILIADLLAGILLGIVVAKFFKDKLQKENKIIIKKNKNKKR